jgi:hypothetical protein
MLAVTGTLGEPLSGLCFSLFCYIRTVMPLTIINNVFREIMHLNLVTFANFLLKIPLFPSIALFCALLIE